MIRNRSNCAFSFIFQHSILPRKAPAASTLHPFLSFIPLTCRFPLMSLENSYDFDFSARRKAIHASPNERHAHPVEKVPIQLVNNENNYLFANETDKVDSGHGISPKHELIITILHALVFFRVVAFALSANMKM